ncbi:hypothetical protein CO676_02600 [Sinorhizobium sp. BJ1]|nr:hypothetical protein CO676_02600 [Sinorhizobium sp. BJ1]
MNEACTIRRGPRTAHYATIPNHVFEDVRLSMGARWLLGYLLSKPDNWQVQIGDICRKGNCGRDKARSMIRELEQTGYAKREVERDPDGRFKRVGLVIYDEPQPPGDISRRNDQRERGRIPSLPATENPSTDYPLPKNPPLSNTEGLANTESQNPPLSSPRGEAREAADSVAKARQQAGEAKGGDRKLFQRLVNNWPGFAGLSLAGAEREFAKLSSEDRETAVKMRDPWFALLRRQGKDHTPAPSTYLKERLWKAVPAAVPQPASCLINAAAPFGKAWMNRLIRLLESDPVEPPPPSRFIKSLIDGGGEAGRRAVLERRAKYGYPAINEMLRRAEDGKGIPVPVDDAVSLPDMEAIAVGSEEFEEWRAVFAERGWPWPQPPKNIKYVWFPAGGPTSLLQSRATSRP